MRDTTVKYKVKVFISSRCGGQYIKYDIVRKALKALLEETNLATVYVFEESEASSQDVADFYRAALDDSDLCVFLIDNEDDVSEAVLSEQKRARELNIKSIYLFCKEQNSVPTRLQEEIMNTQKEKYLVVNEFSDLAYKAYESVLRDIISIYRNYCKGDLVKRDKENIKENEVEIKYLTIDTYVIDKKIYSGFDLTKETLKKTVFNSKKEVKAVSELDNLFSQFLNIIIGNVSKESLDFDVLKNELCNIHEHYLEDFLKLRIEALKCYFSGQINECLINLKKAYKEADKNEAIPNWLSNDVLIDMRNVLEMLDRMDNKFFSLSNEAQNLINENKESIYFPIVDRIDSTIKDKLLEKCLKAKIESPFTTSFGGVQHIFENIAMNFVISVLYGSLTHSLMTRDRIISVLSNICFVYNNHSFYIELLKELIMNQQIKELEEIERAYNQTTEMINQTDINKIINSLESISIPYKKQISKLLIFKHFGYYLSDSQYIIMSQEFLEEINEWIDNPNRMDSMSNYVFEALIDNVRRLDDNKILEFIVKIFNQNLYGNMRKALEVIDVLKISTLQNNLKEHLVSTVIDIISDEKKREICAGFEKTLIIIRKNIDIKENELDVAVREYLPKFFSGNYSLEVFPLKKVDDLKHIEEYIQNIHNQNIEQGVNGTYHGYSSDPYQVIINIIEFDDLQLNCSDVEPILNVLDETMKAKNQIVSNKIGAIKLMMCLINRIDQNEILKKVFNNWIEKENEILNGHEDLFFLKDSNKTLYFNFLMLKVIFGQYDINEVMELLSNYAREVPIEIIKSLRCIEALLCNIDLKKMESMLLILITQYVVGVSFHKDLYVRCNTVKVLIQLCKSSCYQSAILRLSKMMDSEHCDVKLYILNGIKDLHNQDDKTIELIKKKGKADNHFLVRKIANDD